MISFFAELFPHLNLTKAVVWIFGGTIAANLALAAYQSFSPPFNSINPNAPNSQLGFLYLVGAVLAAAATHTLPTGSKTTNS